MQYTLRIPLTDEGREAIMSEASERKIPAAELVRQCVAAQLDRPEIADMPAVGYRGHRRVREQAEK